MSHELIDLLRHKRDTEGLVFEDGGWLQQRLHGMTLHAVHVCLPRRRCGTITREVREELGSGASLQLCRNALVERRIELSQPTSVFAFTFDPDVPIVSHFLTFVYNLDP